MFFLKIIGIVFAVLVLLVAVILSLPVSIIIRSNKENRLKVLFSVLGKSFGDKPRRKKTDNPLAAALKKIIGVGQTEDKKKSKSSAKDGGFATKLTDTIATLKPLLDRIFWLLPRARIKKLHIVSISAGDDAADTALHYGAVCAVVYPLISYIQSLSRVSKKAVDTRISCDFDAPESIFELDIKISFTVLLLLRALWQIAKEQILNNRR